jgi:DNA modification methylase
LDILNPKRASESATGRASWYPYYAGFSEQFATRLIASSKISNRSIVSDPWNGSGTTTAAAAGLAHDAFGCDLNPVMVLAARARTLSKREKNSLVPLGRALLKAAKRHTGTTDDPLEVWFVVGSAATLRSIEKAIQSTLITTGTTHSLLSNDLIQQASDLAAFFYIALFRAIRGLLARFSATNPTWVKAPLSGRQRLRSSRKEIEQAFTFHVNAMAAVIPGDALTKDGEVRVLLASSEKLPLADSSVDLVLSSPPYCTRIDYAVATKVELATLGYRIDAEFDELRRKLIGTTTVPVTAPEIVDEWGPACTSFLAKMAAHKSHASATYYLKNHLQYFASVHQSLREVSRTLKPTGICVLVVQDSHYKDIHTNLPAIITEMSGSHGLALKQSVHFRHEQTMAAVNPRVRKYRRTVEAVESVLCFSRN